MEPKQEEAVFNLIFIHGDERIVKTEPCKRKRPSLTEKAKKVKRDSERNRGKRSKWTDITSMESTPLCVRMCTPVDMCFSLAPSLKRVQKKMIKTCYFINITESLLFLSTVTGGSNRNYSDYFFFEQKPLIMLSLQLQHQQ